jgi:hypothetical protein
MLKTAKAKDEKPKKIITSLKLFKIFSLSIDKKENLLAGID